MEQPKNIGVEDDKGSEDEEDKETLVDTQNTRKTSRQETLEGIDTLNNYYINQYAPVNVQLVLHHL